MPAALRLLHVPEEIWKSGNMGVTWHLPNRACDGNAGVWKEGNLALHETCSPCRACGSRLQQIPCWQVYSV